MHELTKLLSTAEAARVLTVQPNTLEKWRHQGVGPAFCKIGGRIAYDPRDIATWLEKRKVTSTSAPIPG